MGNAPLKKGEAIVPKYYRVRLVITPIGPLLPKFQAYHTSVCVDDIEFSFSFMGISCQNGQKSHEAFHRGQSPIVLDMGRTVVPPRAMLTVLQPHFLPGTYDLLRKNCNSFSDCALYHLLGKRLDDEYRAPEKLGAQWDKYIGIVQNFTGGAYQPNPQADGFQSCMVVAKLAKVQRGDDPVMGRIDPKPVNKECADGGNLGWKAFGA